MKEQIFKGQLFSVEMLPNKNEGKPVCRVNGLVGFIDKKDVECLIFDYSSNNIPLGWCFVNDEEINAMLIDKGFALSY